MDDNAKGGICISEQFDGVAAEYRDLVTKANRLSGRSHSFFVAEKARVLDGLSSEVVGVRRSLLDVGCGTGTVHSRMMAAGWSVTGVDPSSESIECAEHENPGASYLCARATEIPLPGDAFDMASAVCVFHHVPPPDRPQVVSEMARLVRPGGIVAIVEHAPHHPYTRHSVAHCPFDDDAILLRRAETEWLLRDVGLGAVRTRYISWTPLGHGLNAIIERLAGALPFGTQYVTFGLVVSRAQESP